MSYTYTPGTRPDALSILRDKGLLDVPPRHEPTPGTFIFSADGHFRIAEDGSQVRVQPRNPVRPVNDALPVHPFINARSLGWSIVVVVLIAALLGLMAVGGK